MKKVIAAIITGILLSICPVQQCLASDCWYYTDSAGIQSYAVHESVVYGIRTSFFLSYQGTVNVSIDII